MSSPPRYDPRVTEAALMDHMVRQGLVDASVVPNLAVLVPASPHGSGPRRASPFGSRRNSPHFHRYSSHSGRSSPAHRFRHRVAPAPQAGAVPTAVAAGVSRTRRVCAAALTVAFLVVAAFLVVTYTRDVTSSMQTIVVVAAALIGLGLLMLATPCVMRLCKAASKAIKARRARATSTSTDAVTGDGGSRGFANPHPMWMSTSPASSGASPPRRRTQPRMSELQLPVAAVQSSDAAIAAAMQMEEAEQWHSPPAGSLPVAPEAPAEWQQGAADDDDAVAIATYNSLHDTEALATPHTHLSSVYGVGEGASGYGSSPQTPMGYVPSPVPEDAFNADFAATEAFSDLGGTVEPYGATEAFQDTVVQEYEPGESVYGSSTVGGVYNPEDSPYPPQYEEEVVVPFEGVAQPAAAIRTISPVVHLDGSHGGDVGGGEHIEEEPPPSARSIVSQDDCAICVNSLSETCDKCEESGNTVCPLASGKCGHTFHRHCLLAWLSTCDKSETEMTCPFDKQPWEWR